MSDISKYFALAADVAKAKSDRRSFLLGAVGIRKDGALVKSANAVSEVPNPAAHAEVRISKKIDIGATIYVVRILRKSDAGYAIARPCKTCQIVLRALRVNKVFYTIDNHQYGCWHPNTDKDTFYYKDIGL